jgi:hypothetical protein
MSMYSKVYTLQYIEKVNIYSFQYIENLQAQI